jgi:hypothetical protein
LSSVLFLLLWTFWEKINCINCTVHEECVNYTVFLINSQLLWWLMKWWHWITPHVSAAIFPLSGFWIYRSQKRNGRQQLKNQQLLYILTSYM